jgi:hypothetical protein
MKALFNLPNTPMCRVVYTRGGTNYGAVMKTPADPDDIRVENASGSGQGHRAD